MTEPHPQPDHHANPTAAPNAGGPVVRVWHDRADRQGRYPTIGTLFTDDGRTAHGAVPSAGRNTTGTGRHRTLDVPSGDVEHLDGRDSGRCPHGFPTGGWDCCRHDPVLDTTMGDR